MNAGKCWVCDKRGTITQYLKRFGTNEHVSQWLGVHKQHSIKKNIDEKHIGQLIKAFEKAGEKESAKGFKKLADKYLATKKEMGKYGMEPKKWRPLYNKFELIGREMIKFVTDLTRG